VRFSRSRVEIYILSKSKIVVSPQSALVVLIPSKFPSGLGAKEVSSARVAYFPAAVLFPSRVELEQWRVPQQSVSCFPEESLEGDIFYAFIM
jgi:hypothetical protein